MPKNKYSLTHAQIKRLSRKAWGLLVHAQTMAKCLPEELGTDVAEGFAESAIENASEALAIMARVKCSLRIERNHNRLEAMANEIAPHELEALRAVKKGADVFSPRLATLLRDLQSQHPDWLALSPAPADSSGTKPFFGAILKRPVLELLEYLDGGAA